MPTYKTKNVATSGVTFKARPTAPDAKALVYYQKLFSALCRLLVPHS